jgi:MFS superfamily sulfate permease-like transporter
VGIQVAIGEFGALLGIPDKAHGTLQQLLVPLRHLNQIEPGTALVGGCVLLVILVLGRFAPKIPGGLLAVVGAIVASAVLGLQRHGIQTIPSIPSGLPHLVIPRAGWHHVPSLLVTAASCTIVIIAQSAATSRSYAMRYNDAFSENRDMVGLAMANVAATMTGTFIVNGSPTKTEMVDMAGGRSQVAQLTTAAFILLVLLFLTGPLSFMPEVVLSAVVFLIGVRLVDIKGMRDLYRLRREEFWIATLTAVTVALVGVKQGILVAVSISVIDHLRVSYHPPTRLLKISADYEAVIEVPVSSKEMAFPGMLVYRFEAPLYYANSEFFMNEILCLVKEAQPELRWLVVRFDTISDVDYSAAKMLLNLLERLKAHNVSLIFSDVSSAMQSLLQHYGLVEALGSDRIFTSLIDTVRAYMGKSSRLENSGVRATSPSV